MSQEVELKYAVEDAEELRDRLEAGLLDGVATLGAEPWRIRSIEDRYVDTAAGAFEAAGLGLRLRRIDGQRLVTVKSTGRADAAKEEPESLHRRLELEAPASARLDPDTWPESAARDRVREVAGTERLRTRFTLRQGRSERDVEDGTDRAVLSLDTTEVRHRGRTLGSFATLEIEASDDSDGFLRRLVAPIEASGLARPETRTKDRIAREMIEVASIPDPRRPPVPKDPGVTADDPLAEAGRKVLALHLARMLANEDGLRLGEESEPVHKMRVATRRMRAAWRVFDGAYRPKAQKRYVKELRGVATALGAVRDMDVQLEDLARYTEGLPDGGPADLEPLAEAWRGRRDRARRDLLSLLDSKAYRTFVDEYLAFVSTPGADADDSDERGRMRVRDTAAGRIWQAYETVRAHDAGLRWADVPALHALRIDGKRLRYTLESFREVLPARQVDELILAVTRMQDHLGLLNDADVAAAATRVWLMDAAAGSTPAAREAAGAYLLAREAEIPRLRRTFPALWRRVAGPTFRRRLALAVSAL